MEQESPFGTTRRVQQDDHQLQVIEVQALTLKIVQGAGKGRKIVFDAPTIRVGKDDENDLVIRDEAVSRRHLKITRDDQGIRLIDLGSTNGTFVNGVRIETARLDPGMKFQLGETVVQVQPRTRELTAVVGEDNGLGHLVGSSPAMREVYGLLSAVADSQVTVLVLGESGTGKEVCARTLHEISGREGPFVVFDCASTSPDLIRSELFGHEEGAFTGAAKRREGAFRSAHKGTLFIDELGELPGSLQPNLLRVLENREVQPIGCDAPIPIDVRVVTATNRDLKEMVQQGTFREDLYHRIAVVPIRLPSLRERRDDISILVSHFVEKLGIQCTFSDAAIDAMRAYPWPGNIRALRNVVERCGILCRGREVTPEDLHLEDAPASDHAVPIDGKTLAEIEKDAILATLRGADGRRRETARRLGVSVTTLRRKLKEYGVGSGDNDGDVD